VKTIMNVSLAIVTSATLITAFLTVPGPIISLTLVNVRVQASVYLVSVILHQTPACHLALFKKPREATQSGATARITINALLKTVIPRQLRLVFQTVQVLQALPTLANAPVPLNVFLISVIHLPTLVFLRVL
jgi:hypothetical protein